MDHDLIPMTSSPTTLQNLLISAKRIADHAAEIRKLKGEDFNIFSILRMETAENATHSAFIGELLNPHGSHLMGNRLLELFLQMIGYPLKDKITVATVILEKHIGFRDDLKKEGGRIDIYISLSDGYTISIENKIYAGDQYAQVERYAKHNSAKNTVYYLTLDGSEPSDESKGDLKLQEEQGNGRGYRCISYSKTIVDWLERCQQAAVDQPILRESIKQYRILIQKLTGNMSDSASEKEIHDLIAANYAGAKVIAAHFETVKWTIATRYLELMAKMISEELGAGWTWGVFQPNQLYVGLHGWHESWGNVEGVSSLELRIWGKHSIDRDPYIGIQAFLDVWDRALILEKLGKYIGLKDHLLQTDYYWAYWEDVNSPFGPNGIDGLPGVKEEQLKKFAQETVDRIVEIAVACKDALKEINRIGQ